MHALCILCISLVHTSYILCMFWRHWQESADRSQLRLDTRMAASFHRTGLAAKTFDGWPSSQCRDHLAGALYPSLLKRY